ncbi:MAG TPA: hypothetical protein VGM88_21285 [Kofleriaceae bacterium]|jgi:hypothetical protein
MSRLPFLVVAVCLGACTASDGADGGMLVSKNVVPGDGCTFTGEENETIIPAGSLQIGFAYYAFPQIKSRITADDDQVDQRTIITTEADVDLTFSDPDLFTSDELDKLKTDGVTHFKGLFSVPVQPNGGIADGSFTMVPTEVSDAITAKLGTVPANFSTTVVGTYTVKGDMAGEGIESNKFQFPVTIIGAGLVEDLGSCPVPSSDTPRSGNPCNVGQDAVYDCCESGGGLICPAPTGGS